MITDGTPHTYIPLTILVFGITFLCNAFRIIFKLPFKSAFIYPNIFDLYKPLLHLYPLNSYLILFLLYVGIKSLSKNDALDV